MVEYHVVATTHSVIAAIQGLGQKDQKFQTSLGNLARFCVKNKNCTKKLVTEYLVKMNKASEPTLLDTYWHSTILQSCTYVHSGALSIFKERQRWVRSIIDNSPVMGRCELMIRVLF